MPFDGLRVLSLESRRAREIEKLIRAQGGEPFVAPSMRELPLEDNPKAFEFAERLLRGEFDMVVLLTGVGTRLLGQVIETRWPVGTFAEALKKVAVIARGSKPVTVLREWNVPIAAVAPEPNTWREVLSVIDGLTAKGEANRVARHVAVQEYGRPSEELVAGLRARGAEVTSVPVYQWDLPEDREPLREAVRRLADGFIDVAVFTTSIQLAHLFRIADEMNLEDAVRRGLNRAVIASVGPTTSETLADFEIKPDFEPSHPKMGFLVNETAANAAKLLARKRVS